MTVRRGEDGSVLIMALVVMMLAMTLVAALLVHATVSVRAERSYKARATRIGAAQDAMAVVIAVVRQPTPVPPATTAPPDGSLQSRTGLLGLDGSTVTRTYAGFVVTCTGDAGSGALTADGTYADRSLTCTDSSGPTTFHFRLHIVDDGGTNLGQSAQVRDSDFQ